MGWGPIKLRRALAGMRLVIIGEGCVSSVRHHGTTALRAHSEGGALEVFVTLTYSVGRRGWRGW